MDPLAVVPCLLGKRYPMLALVALLGARGTTQEDLVLALLGLALHRRRR